MGMSAGAMEDVFEQASFPHKDSLIHLFVGGSELHGAKVQGTDDTDIYGLFIEPPEEVLGLDKFEHFVWSSSPQEERNKAHDIDVTLYSVRKWAGMAMKGNPTALHFLFAFNQYAFEDPAKVVFWGEFCWKMKKLVIAKSASKQFMGFVDAQMGRLLGTRGRGKKGQRPELELTYGYDVKAGMHSVRLLYECIELMRRHEITFPSEHVEELIAIRSGNWSLDYVSNRVNQLFRMLDEAVYISTLPAEPDRHAVSELVTRTYLDHWKKKGFW